jgi:hypothetical protein
MQVRANLSRHSRHDLTHFIFWFHDSTFECVARSYKVETYQISFKNLLNRMLDRLVFGA